MWFVFLNEKISRDPDYVYWMTKDNRSNSNLPFSWCREGLAGQVGNIFAVWNQRNGIQLPIKQDFQTFIFANAWKQTKMWATGKPSPNCQAVMYKSNWNQAQCSGFVWTAHNNSFRVSDADKNRSRIPGSVLRIKCRFFFTFISFFSATLFQITFYLISKRRLRTVHQKCSQSSLFNQTAMPSTRAKMRARLAN